MGISAGKITGGRPPGWARVGPVSFRRRSRRSFVAARVAWGRIVCIGGRGRVVAAWPVAGEGRPDLATVDALAQLQLAARRLGVSIEVREMCGELAALVELVGLRRELGREPESREHGAGVEEAVKPGDPIP